MAVISSLQLTIIKYIPLQQGLRLSLFKILRSASMIIKYIPLQQGLRLIMRLGFSQQQNY